MSRVPGPDIDLVAFFERFPVILILAIQFSMKAL
jgi:hypothetical protein